MFAASLRAGSQASCSASRKRPSASSSTSRPKSREQLADEPGVLDLLDRAGRPEERLVVLAEVLRQRGDVRQLAVADRREARAVAHGHELRVVRELASACRPSRRGLLRAPLARLAPWAGSSSGRRSSGPDRHRRPLRDRRRRRRSLRALRGGAHPAGLADRRGDRARGRAHGPGDRRLPERELRQRAGADHRAVRRLGRLARGRARVARSAASSRTSCSCSGSPCSAAAATSAADRPALDAHAARARACRRAALPRALRPGLARRPRAALARGRDRARRDRAARPLRRA